MPFLPSVVRAEYRGGFRIHLAFNDASEGTVDFEAWLDGPVFEPLKNTPYFRRFFIEGGTVVWPNGADIAPETLYAAAQASRSITGLQPTAPAAIKRRRG
jgi:Protein of unknown function (DUF2442)